MIDQVATVHIRRGMALPLQQACHTAHMAAKAGWEVRVMVSTKSPHDMVDFFCKEQDDQQWFRIIPGGEIEAWDLPDIAPLFWLMPTTADKFIWEADQFIGDA